MLAKKRARLSAGAALVMESIALAWLLSDSAIIVTPGFAQQASSAAAYATVEASSDEAVADDATIVVFGNGQTRQVAGLEADDVTSSRPATGRSRRLQRLWEDSEARGGAGLSPNKKRPRVQTQSAS